MKSKITKIIALTIMAVMVFSVVPAFAENGETELPINSNGFITIEDAEFENTYQQTEDGTLLVESFATITLENDLQSYTLDISVLEGYSIIVFADPFLSKELALPAQINLNQGITNVYVYMQNDSDDTEGLLVPIVIASQRTPTEYADADDISSWAKTAVDALNESGVGLLIGDDNKNFNPKKDITRYEMAVVVTKLMGIDPQCFEDYDLIYDDEIVSWAAPYVRCAAAMNVMVGQQAGDKVYFNGASNTTRQEFCKVITDFWYGINSLGQMDTLDFYSDSSTKTIVDLKFDSLEFADESELASWAAPYVKTAVYLELVNGSSENGKLMLKPKSNITRQEVSVIIFNLLTSDMNNI
jgi:beta-N-acetylhexosaminidase